MPKLNVVKQVQSQEQVFFGAWVTLEDDDSNTYRYRIVGADEFDNDDNYISIDSPLAKALIKKQLDDEIFVETKNGTKEYLIVAIDYLL